MDKFTIITLVFNEAKNLKILTNKLINNENLSNKILLNIYNNFKNG